MTRAAIYCRVSSRSQEDGESLGTQERECRDYCAAKGYEVGPVFHEVYTGTALDRPQLSILRRQIAAGEVGVAVVWHSDRLSRDPKHRITIRVEAEASGVKYESVTDPMADDEFGELIDYLSGWAAGNEVKRNAARSIANTRSRVEQGGKLIGGGKARYGYRWTADRGGYVEHPDEAEVVRLIYRLAADGLGIRGIGRELAARGIPAPKGGAVWSLYTLTNIVRDRDYLGEKEVFEQKVRKVGGVTVRERRQPVGAGNPDGSLVLVVPPLVDEVLWYRANVALDNGDRRKAQRYAPGTDPKDVLVRGFVVCASCGNRMVVARNKGEGAYLKCQTREQRRGCKPNKIVARKLDAAAWDHLSAVLLDPEAARQKFIESADSGEAERLRGLIETAIGRIRESDRRIDRLLEGVADAESAAERDLYRRRIREEQARIEEVRREQDEATFRLRTLEGQERAVFDLLAAMDQNLGEVMALDYDGRRRAMERIGLRIEVKPTAEVGPGEDRWRLSFNLQVALPARMEGRSEEAWTADDESEAEGWLAEQVARQVERPTNWSRQRERQPQDQSDSRRPFRGGDSTPRGLSSPAP